MKNKLILIITALTITFLFSCAEPGEEAADDPEPEVVVVEPPGPIIPDTEPDASDDTPPEPDTSSDELIIIKFAVKTADNFYLSDHTQMFSLSTGAVKKAGDKIFQVSDATGDFVHVLNIYGQTVSKTEILHAPSAIKTIDGDNYFCKEYSAQEAYAMGGLARIYSEIYKNNDVLSPWYNNQFACGWVKSVGTDYFISDSGGTIKYTNSAATSFTYVMDNHFVMSDVDMTNKEIDFNGTTENYGLNYIFNATNWILHDEKYYSETGHTYDAIDGLTEEITTLKAFNSTPYPITPAPPASQAPNLISAGSSGNLLYWIETNSGWLFEYHQQIDTLEQKYRLYNGNGMRATGNAKKLELKPFISENWLYFSHESSIFRLDLNTGIISVFYAGNGEIVRYE